VAIIVSIVALLVSAAMGPGALVTLAGPVVVFVR